MYSKRQRTIALAALIAFIFVSLFSTLFIVKAENHKCVGEDCPICAAVQNAEHTLKSIHSFDLAACVTAVIASVFFAPVLTGVFSVISYSSPVTQKVRMDN